MSLRKLYHWVRQTSKDWQGVTRHVRENVCVFSRAVVYAQSSQIRKISGAAGGRADSRRRRLQRLVETWREEYNPHRPHSSLGFRSPADYAHSFSTLTPTGT